MDLNYRDNFLGQWGKYFPHAELPITFYYTDNPGALEMAEIAVNQRCFIADLAKIRKGFSFCFDNQRISCSGGLRYLGFNPLLRPKFEYFLSCGIEGEMEGERYKKTPELVKELLAKSPVFNAPAKFLVAKRWDKLDEQDEPELVTFFAPPDVLSGLFTLVGFESSDLEMIIAPFCAGCGSIVYHPYQEFKSGRGRAVIGMFDVSARPYVQPNVLTLTIPRPKFDRMVADMDESFLITESWHKVQKRIENYLRKPSEHEENYY